MSESDSKKSENTEPKWLRFPGDVQPKVVSTRTTKEGLVIHRISADTGSMIIMPAGTKNDKTD